MRLRHQKVLVVFTIGIPNGSLINPKRGGLKELLDSTGILVDNLGNNAPPKIKNIPWLKAVSGRPQELPVLAYLGYVDIFFCGDDWAEEWKLRGKENKKLLGLDIGKVDIVFAEKKENSKFPIKIATEYPFIARKFVCNEYKIPDAPIIDVGEDIPYKKEVVIIKSIGATEAKVYYYNGKDYLADAIVEATQSQSTINNYGLNVSKKIMSSECSLYISPKVNNRLLDKAEILKSMLEETIYSQYLKTSRLRRLIKWKQ